MGALEAAVLFVVMVVLALVPSTSVALVVARSSTAGFPSGAAVAAGIVLGDLVFVLLAVLGMAALADAMGSFFLILRYIAAAYLICLGIGLLRSKASSLELTASRSVSTLSADVLSGLIITLGDVKAIFFYASLFPAFVDLANIKTSDIASIVVLTIFAVGGVKLGYAYAARRVVSLAEGFRARRAAKVVAGGFMVSLGAYLLTTA